MTILSRNSNLPMRTGVKSGCCEQAIFKVSSQTCSQTSAGRFWMTRGSLEVALRSHRHGRGRTRHGFDLRNCGKWILIRPHGIDGLLSSSGNTVVTAVAFIRTVRRVICRFQLGKIDVLAWNIFHWRIGRFAKRQGVSSIGNYTARDGYDNTSRIGLDGNRMIWIWKFDLLCFHVLGVLFLLAKRMAAASTNSVGAVWCASLLMLKSFDDIDNIAADCLPFVVEFFRSVWSVIPRISPQSFLRRPPGTHRRCRKPCQS